MANTEVREVLAAAERRARALAAGDVATLNELMPPSLQWTTFTKDGWQCLSGHAGPQVT
jgi:hypothetical protein